MNRLPSPASGPGRGLGPSSNSTPCPSKCFTAASRSSTKNAVACSMSGTVMPTCSTPRSPGSPVPLPIVVDGSSTLPPFELGGAIVLPTGMVDPEEPEEGRASETRRSTHDDPPDPRCPALVRTRSPGGGSCGPVSTVVLTPRKNLLRLTHLDSNQLLFGSRLP